MPAITRILKGCFFRIKGDDFVVHANITIFRTLDHDLKFKTKKSKENPLRMCVSFSSPLRRSVCVCVWVGWGEGDATLPPNNLSQQLINKNTPSLARISKIKKSLLIINFPIVFQFATFPIQKLDFIRTLKKKRKRLRHCLRSTLNYHYDC